MLDGLAVEPSDTSRRSSPGLRRASQMKLTEMTPAQAESAKRTCERFNVPFWPHQWSFYDGTSYIGKWFNGCLGNIFIGIEKDGYAHS